MAHIVVVYGALFEGVGTPLLPYAGIGVVATFERLGVHIFGIFEVGPAVGTDVSKLTVFAHLHLVFGYVPVFLEVGMVECLLQGGVFDIAEGLCHGGAVFDVALGVYGDFAIEAGVVVEGFGK
jgi:hypothetical protein